jgi:hypothetical protein
MAPSFAPSLLAPRSLPRKRHVYVDANMGKDLGANNDGAKLRVYFLKS